MTMVSETASEGASTPARMPTLFIPHGGGPCFFMEPRPGMPADTWDAMARYLRGIAGSLPRKPKAVVVISGHWEERVPTVHVAEHPGLYYDYYGFPPHTYQLKYPVSGAPDVAGQVRELLGAAGFETATEAARGLDHGVFIPFMLVFPDADVPVVQLSLKFGFDPAEHQRIGAALAPLRDEDVLIVGSGMSFHNLRTFFRPGAADAQATEFDTWLTDAVTAADPAIRTEKLSHWGEAPSARACHPEEEHLLPLMVAAGAGGTDRGRHVYSDKVMGKALSAYQFG